MEENPGRDYLEAIRDELASGRRQHRMGESLLRAFGYMRRRATALEEINSTLRELGLVATPPVNADMPLRTPRIVFALSSPSESIGTEVADEFLDPTSGNVIAQIQDLEVDGNLPEPSFRVSELESAKTNVERVSHTDSISAALTKMSMYDYSQLVVASHDEAKQHDIKGVVSFKSITQALMKGTPVTAAVGVCIEKVPIVSIDDDLVSIIPELNRSEVVLVVGRKRRLQGIVTPWDLANEFSVLIEPFMRIGEIERHLRSLIEKHLPSDCIAEFLNDAEIPVDGSAIKLSDLTLGEIQRILEYPNHWGRLNLPYDRKIFIDGLDGIRNYRNRLMHFKEPLQKSDTALLANFCNMLRVTA